MSILTDALAAELAGGKLDALAGALGLTPDQTQTAVASALPLLISSMSRNAADADGAASLATALEQDHSRPLSSIAQQMGGLGPLLELAMGASKEPRALDGAGILGHLLGGLQGEASASMARQLGLDPATALKLLTGLAPLVMSTLGTLKQERSLDPMGLAGLLQQEQAQLEEASGADPGLLAGLVDSGGDGVGLDDLARIGGALSRSGLLGKLFG